MTGFVTASRGEREMALSSSRGLLLAAAAIVVVQVCSTSVVNTRYLTYYALSYQVHLSLGGEEMDGVKR